MKLPLLFLLASSFSLVVGAESIPRAAPPAPPVQVAVADVEARLVIAGAEAGEWKAVALLFMGRECPISNAMVPEVNRIIEKYEPSGIAFYFVFPESDLSDAGAALHAKEFGLRAPFVVDRDGRLVAKAGARVTPEAAVFGAGAKVMYRGRIDDLYAGLGQRRETARAHDLRDALDAVAAGRLPRVAFVQPVGCFISLKP